MTLEIILLQMDAGNITLAEGQHRIENLIEKARKDGEAKEEFKHIDWERD